MTAEDRQDVLRTAIVQALTTTWAAWSGSNKTVYERLEECADSVVDLLESGDIHRYDPDRLKGWPR